MFFTLSVILSTLFQLFLFLLFQLQLAFFDGTVLAQDLQFSFLFLNLVLLQHFHYLLLLFLGFVSALIDFSFSLFLILLELYGGLHLSLLKHLSLLFQ